MEGIGLNTILNRNTIEENIRQSLVHFDNHKSIMTEKRGIYIYGEPGIGKTTFVKNLLESMDYDILHYNAGDMRNKTVIESIAKHNMAEKNVLSMFSAKKKNIAIFMDEIDGMNNGDKGGINTMIKMLRPKKTKKQKQEDYSMNPVICVGNHCVDKKMKELMKVCHVFHLEKPQNSQIRTILSMLMPEYNNENVISYIQCDLKKLDTLYYLYTQNKNMISDGIFVQKSYNDNIRNTTKYLMNKNVAIHEHSSIINETDRTIIALLWHENIIDLLAKQDFKKGVKLYTKLLYYICFGDFLDRVTFQKQIWQFNEMTSLIKTIQCNHIYHKEITKKVKFNPSDIRFTKILTKYSTEYNNSNFILYLCQQLNMDKNDMLSFFYYLHSQDLTESQYENLFENYEVNKLDIQRIMRYIYKFNSDSLDDFNESFLYKEES